MTTAPPAPSPELGPAQKSSTDWVWHLSFGLLLAITFIWFVFWSNGYVHPGSNKIILVTAIIFALFMAFNIGGNDVANSFGTSVGAGTLTMKQALVVAAIFEVSGAILAGGEVTNTVRSGIVDLTAINNLDPMEFVFIMMAALLGAAVWLLLATRMGWPVSTTHSIIGGIVGAALTVGFMTGTGSWSMVQWSEIGRIALSWVLSPVLGGLAAFLLFGWIKRAILVYNDQADEQLIEIKDRRARLHEEHKTHFDAMSRLQQISYTHAMARDAALLTGVDKYDPEELESEYYRELHAINEKMNQVDAHRALEHWVPVLAAFGAVVISSMLLFKGLKHTHIDFTALQYALIIGMVGAAVWMAVSIYARSLKHKSLSRSTFLIFSWMQVFTASAFAFSHGSNDIANAIGPFIAVLDVLQNGTISAEAAVPPEVMIAMVVALTAGLWFIGRFVIKTVGSDLTVMHPSSGFAAELAAAGVVMAASIFGLPVSSTHILIGAVLGVGVVNRAANWTLMKPIGLAWIITLPASAGIAAVTVSLLRVVF
ncbi:inorganic phosphate transporter [Corynebacterium lizhenjunii]|uniref:Phosphate transporter n=1 Tax=Corynebacterium lizhenjunii TaxID=2709394 RepID=A0A7T0PAC5_9CORY|nr:inorganic phosphate transporter [Corynebacterium lizhenjunii]QPK78225.1 inorganic phosphate transporter [Corynebacterium lizhenjunii]